MPSTPHLTAEEVAALAQRLELQLPAAYVEGLIHCPFPLDSDLAEVVFIADPKRIFDKNDYYRREGFFGHAWPKHFLIIGGLGDGDVLFLDTTREAPVVMTANHDQSSDANHLVVAECWDGAVLPGWFTTVLEGWREIRKWESERGQGE